LSKSISIKIDDEKHARLQRIRKAYRVNVNRSGFIERVSSSALAFAADKENPPGVLVRYWSV